MTNQIGHCKHGEFGLADGCKMCVAEAYQGLGGTLTPDAAAEAYFTPPDNARVKVQPEQDVQVMAFYSEALSLQKYAESRVIATAADLRPATDDLSIISRLKKSMEAKRKDYLAPFQEHIKEVNEAYKRLMEPIERADRITRSKILAFQAEQDRIRREEEEINRKRLEAAQAEMKLKGELSESVNLVEVSPEAPRRTTTDLGSVGQRMIRKYRVVDFAALPDQYKIENSALLNKVVKAGIPSIPGVDIYEEPILAVNTK